MLQLLWVIIGGVIALILPERRPRQIALAVALGTVLGLIPKDNLLAGILVLMIFLFRVNLGIGIMAAALGTWGGIYLESYADRIGFIVLNLSMTQSMGMAFFELPFVAWTSLNNTIVLGEFLFGLILFWPLYKISYLFCSLFFPCEKAKAVTSASASTVG